MIKVLTACTEKHLPYLDECKQSVARSRVAHTHIVSVGNESKATHMNRMLKSVSNDDIVAVMDADDKARPDWLENASFLGGFDLVYGDVVNNTHDSHETIFSMPFDKGVFKRKNFIPYSGVILKGWLAKSEPYPEIVHGNDWLWWWRLLQHSDRFLYVPQVFCIRKTWTSHKRCNIPVYRKIRRLYRDYKVKQKINVIASQID